MIKKPIDKVETLAEEVVFFDPSDIEGATSLAYLLNIISDWLVENDFKIQADLLIKYKNLITEQNISDVHLKSLETLVSSLQSLIRDNRNVNELDWPDIFQAKELPKVTLPANVDKELFEEYLKTQVIALEEIDLCLLQLEKSNNNEVLGELCRKLHTLKGESGLMGLQEVEHVCHKMEDSLESFSVESNPDFYFNILDWLKSAINYYSGDGEFPDLLDFTNINKTTLPNKPIKETKNKDLNTSNHISNNTLHINAERVDALVDAIGELVVVESMVSESPEINQFASVQLKSYLNQISKITRELQTLGMGMRMVPIRGAFNKMARLVRDLGKKYNKQIKFFTEGEGTEIDKQVAERISDSLVHLVRNSIDHGIEDNPQERLDYGKDITASITLRAFHKGGNIVIEVEDDGRGLDADVIVNKAKQKGLISNENLTEAEIFNLIFEPGFSTASQVSDVSGRGVGMDVVNQTVSVLQGSIDIQSTKNKGCLFSISLPLTLAIIDGLIIRSGNEKYILPALSVINSLRPDTKDVFSVLGQGEVVKFQEELIPVNRLSNLFDVKGVCDEKIFVIVIDQGNKIALVVDELLGKQQVVIKNLGHQFNSFGISGGAIMADGKVGLIIDVADIINEVKCESKNI